MNYTELYDNIRRKGSFLCVGLDTDPAKIPACVRERHGDASMLAFNKAIIDATAPTSPSMRPREYPAGSSLPKLSVTSAPTTPTS